MPISPTTVTRDQLYELVWSTPIIRLAEMFGLSDNGLRKICRRLDVPCPPPGFWAKKAAGKTVKVAALPQPRAGRPLQAVISPAREGATELRQHIRNRSAAIGAIAVPQRLTRPHPVIVGWLDDHRRRRDEARRHHELWPGSTWAIAALSEADRHRHRILHALFRTLEQHGATISEDERRQLFVELSGERIGFTCREKLRQTKRPLTADERRWGFWDKAGVRQELEPTGRLEFSIRVWLDQPIRRTWLESEDRQLDGMLPEIVATFLELGPVLAERTRRREVEARAFAERQRLAELERQRREQDDRRWARFLQLASAWQQAELARAFITRLRDLHSSGPQPIDGRSLDEWLEWAERRAVASDPVQRGSAYLFDEVAQVKAWTRLD